MTLDQLFIDELVPHKGLLALVVDDSNNARVQKTQLLEQGGFRVIPAGDEISAEREFLASPAISIALVDINLHPDRDRDKSGFDLAWKLRNSNPRLPIVGYSAHFAEGDIVSKPNEPFTSTFARGASTASEIVQNIGRWMDDANQYWEFRVQSARAKLEELRIKHPRGPIDFDIVRVLVPRFDGEKVDGVSTVEETLRVAGYELRVVEPGQRRPTISGAEVAVPHPIWIWTKNAGDHFVAEIYGYPELYSVADTEKDAIKDLLLLMDGFQVDLASDTTDATEGRVEALNRFLRQTLGVRT